MEVRIIGMLPVIETLNTETGTTRREGLFWIYFPEARYIFANHEVYNSSNDGARMTFEDLFRKRMFSGFIYKENNVFDNRILKSYTRGIDRLLEAEKIKAEIVNFEHDMWAY
jgi:gliding motility associated protien GldN